MSIAAYWTEDEIQTLLQMRADDETWVPIAKAVGKTPRSCRWKYDTLSKAEPHRLSPRTLSPQAAERQRFIKGWPRVPDPEAAFDLHARRYLEDALAEVQARRKVA